MSTDLPEVPKVLVVEDEMMLRMRAVDIVEDAGFSPVQAVDADQALSILEARSDISLLFTDIQMPGSMDGLKLAHAVHDRWPAIRIILVSGQVKPTDAEKPKDSRFFGKPLSNGQMIAELQAMVGAGALKTVPVASLLLADELGYGPQSVDDKLRSVQEGALVAENDSLRLLLEQADVDFKALLKQSGIDAEERDAADKLQRLIVGELNHRIKNNIAIVSAIALQSFRTTTSIEHGQMAMEGRLLALSRAHDLLMQVNWSSASLTRTVSGATEPFDSQGNRRFHFNGPDIKVASGAVIALAMTLNELCTNTTKFGALSTPAGSVEVAWKIDEKTQRLCLTWTERGGPPVQPPTRRSFGTRMMESLGQQLNGEVQLSYEPSGFFYSLDVPLSSVIAKA
ncbi:HWE histidine kinase domain-containing protein [Bradyrhizobium sp. AUGA SZCCT0124]|uniref:sensor histidine kinase n=1 Tax=unclassified Bradyrhizobium TaxID=2631580 RepID=UPI001BA9D7A0|nr:response regulator [Bradyrhizobium sp. AUGA SZCCT0124]MBR1317042.1 response regulator [Bradyrhizobium sp. AUGA SZCCT0051]MBR1345224.1 response regulator [Bradyrhizobium sp. AUGA SZCCT0105]MBR1360285.1 response regulator [Bradyrhizobium sp. AUGA SZCCT0045]